jgi:RNA polymerase sigma factor (sigma-70 family)
VLTDLPLAPAVRRASSTQRRRAAARVEDLLPWEEIHRRLQRDRNDGVAWNSLVHCVRAWARRDLASRGEDAVEDAVADACAEVVLTHERARGPETFRGFVCGHYLSARRRVLHHLAGPPAVPLDGVDPPSESTAEPDDPALAALPGCLGALPERERRAVQLRYLEDASAAAMAAILGVTENHARQIVFRGLAHLRRELAAALGQSVLAR